MKKIIFIVLFILFVLIAIYFFIISKKPRNYIESYGNVEIRQVDLSFQVDGIIENVFVEEGDCIKKGDLLATLISKDYIANYKKALSKEKASKARRDEDISKYNRNHPLCLDDTISKEECTTLLNNKNYSIAKYSEDSANREYEKNQLDYTKLFAPQDGIISTRSQEKGARVASGQIVYVMNLNKPIWIRTYVNEKDLGNIKYNMKADVLTDTLDIKTGKKKTYKGRIGYISPVAEFTPKTVQTKDLRVDLMYRLRIYIDEADDFLRQGMPVTIQINLDNKDE